MKTPSENDGNLEVDKTSTYASLKNKDLTIDYKGKPFSTIQLLCSSPFDQPSMNHSFTSEKCFDHILFHLQESNMLTTYDIVQTVSSHPSYPNFNNTKCWSKTIEFSSLLTPITSYKTQKIIEESREQLHVTCLFFYKLHLPSVVRYLRRNHTGVYRNIDSIQATFRKK